MTMTKTLKPNLSPLPHNPDNQQATLPMLVDRVSFMIHRIGEHMARICNPWFQEWGLDLVTSRMMVALLERETMTAGEIVKIMALPQSTISHQLKRLEGLGYLTRTVGADDSRIVVARLTERGLDVAQRSNQLSRTVVTQLVSAIGEDDLDRVRAALKRADVALEAMFDATAASAPRSRRKRQSADKARSENPH
jgi:DNA-binding MarR family transcriptional regulator